MRMLIVLLLVSGCTTAPIVVTELQNEVPLCPDAMAFAERSLDEGKVFDARNEVYRQENESLCRGI